MGRMDDHTNVLLTQARVVCPDESAGNGSVTRVLTFTSEEMNLMARHKVLLLNASNMEAYPVYPYAFIQVPAIARKSGIEVICKDLLGIPQEEWASTVQGLIRKNRPTMILITLRNTDSGVSEDYKQSASNEENGRAYFPIERTRELILSIRTVTNLKITLGGFGFSVMPTELMHKLRPDYGVCGEPDAFFAHFEDVLRGNLSVINNLLFFKDEHLHSNPRVFYPPLNDTEYTPQVIDDMRAFYQTFPKPGFEGASIEISRGCCHSCVFCSEPHVKGRRVRYRDLASVSQDIEFLVNHKITRLYIISSELNPEGNSFVLQLADLITTLNKRHSPNSQITWDGANYLLNFSTDEYQTLYRSGFTGGWFDITALDDENARSNRTPYRNKNLASLLKSYAQSEFSKPDLLKGNAGIQPEASDNHVLAKLNKKRVRWTLFLGNPATTMKTIRRTLKIANQEGLAQLFTDCHINTNIRVFDYEKPDAATLDVTYSVTPCLEHTSYQQILPSYAYPPALLQHFGSKEDVDRMFAHIADTYLTTKYHETREWLSFLKQKTSAISIARWVAELSLTYRRPVPIVIKPTKKGKVSIILKKLFIEESSRGNQGENVELANVIVEWLLSASLALFSDHFESMGFPNTIEKIERMTPYALALTLSNRWGTEKFLIDKANEQTKLIPNELLKSCFLFCIKALLYKYNLLLTSKYRALFSENMDDSNPYRQPETCSGI
jgi:hypothetical protein